KVETDVRALAPPDLPALQDLNDLEKQTGISGDVNVTIKAPDPTAPDVVAWAANFQQRVLAKHGFSGENPSCADAQICPAISLTDFLGGGAADSGAASSSSASPSSGSTPSVTAATAGNLRPLIEALPCFISQIVIGHRGECSASS